MFALLRGSEATKGDMRPVVNMMALLRLLILAWLMTWVATASLFNTYLPGLPDTTDGLASLQSARQTHFFHLSNLVSHVPECDVALLDDDDSKKRKMGKPSILGVLCHLSHRTLLLHSVIESRAIQPRLLLFATLQGPRAPPSVLSF